MSPFDPLLAKVDLEDVIRVVVIVLILVVPVIAQLVAKIRQIPPPNQRPIPPRPAPPDNVADEIEEFMRRAAPRRPTKGVRPVVIEASPVIAETVEAQPVKAEVMADAARPVGGQVAEHVTKYLDEQSFTEREAALGRDVAQADREIDQRLRQKFDHGVSQLAAVPGEAAKPPVAYEPPNLTGATEDIPATFATGLLDLVANPESLRQAIILSEILHRPEERWD